MHTRRVKATELEGRDLDELPLYWLEVGRRQFVKKMDGTARSSGPRKKSKHRGANTGSQEAEGLLM